MENLATSVRTFKTRNYSAVPEEKWLLVGLLNNTTPSCALLVVLLLPHGRTKPFMGNISTEKVDFK